MCQRKKKTCMTPPDLDKLTYKGLYSVKVSLCSNHIPILSIVPFPILRIGLPSLLTSGSLINDSLIAKSKPNRVPSRRFVALSVCLAGMKRHLLGHCLSKGLILWFKPNCGSPIAILKHYEAKSVRNTAFGEFEFLNYCKTPLKILWGHSRHLS